MEAGVDQMVVLVVEDNPIDLQHIIMMLRRVYGDGCDIRQASNSVTASNYLGEYFDVCLMDFHLESVTAFQLLSKFDAEDLPGPIICITSEESPSVESKGADYGIADFIKKTELNDTLLKRSIRYCTSRHTDLRRMSSIAKFDGLTGLVNRAAFMHRLQSLLASEVVDPDKSYLFYLDIDNFKFINDAYGHAVGDRVLDDLARRLTASARNTDIIGRLGGDEFVIAVTGVNRNEIEALAEKFIESTRRKFIVDELELAVSISCGVVRFSQCHTEDSDILVMADEAMYRAKLTGKDKFCFYDDSRGLIARNRAIMVQELRSALERDELHLIYEPQICLKTGKATGAEALVRWLHPERGLIRPKDFIPVAESGGLILLLGNWVLKTALEACSKWQQSHHLPEGFCVAINVSATQLLSPDFIDTVKAELKERDLPANCLQLEITENALLGESAVVKQQLERAAKLGISIAIDDFGTGYSNLSRIQKLPIDTLKLDISFVSKIDIDPSSLVLVQCMVQMAHALDMKVVAEGVANERQVELLNELDCELAQGWYYEEREMLADQFFALYGAELEERTATVELEIAE